MRIPMLVALLVLAVGAPARAQSAGGLSLLSLNSKVVAPTNAPVAVSTNAPVVSTNAPASTNAPVTSATITPPPPPKQSFGQTMRDLIFLIGAVRDAQRHQAQQAQGPGRSRR